MFNNITPEIAFHMIGIFGGGFMFGFITGVLLLKVIHEENREKARLK